MSATYKRTCDLGLGYKVTFTLTPGEMFQCSWDPEMPPREIGKILLPAYQRERNAFLQSTGIPMMVVDL